MNLKMVKGGLQRRDWNPDKRADDVTPIVPASARELLRYWHERIEIADDYTLRDLIAMLAVVGVVGRDADLIGDMCEMDLGRWLDEACKKPTEHEPYRIDFLHVYNHADLDKYVEDPEKPDTACIDAGDFVGKMYGTWVGHTLSRGFGGWGTWDDEYCPPGTKGGISISFLPIQNLLDLPLKYDPKVEFWPQIRDTKDYKPLFSTTIDITLGEFIRAVLFEIGWHGDPEQTEARGRELEQMADEVRDELAAQETPQHGVDD